MRALLLATALWLAALPASAERMVFTPSLMFAGTTITSALPSCAAGTSGTYYLVTDALTPVLGSTLVGGGAITVTVKCNGTNWLVI